MEEILFYFAISWVLAVVVGAVIWKFSKRWPRTPRVLAASFATAFFVAPSFVVGHGFAPAPLPFQLIFQPSGFDGLVAIFFGVTWALTLLVFCVLSAPTR